MVQKRVLFFVQDGSGLGHLSRISRIADAIQGPYSTLIVTGKREAAFIVSEKCEFIHIPSWTSVRRQITERGHRSAWLDLDDRASLKLIADLCESIERVFSPDVMVVDYLPLGRFGEFSSVIQNSNAKKYLILRGIIDDSDRETFCGADSKVWGHWYDRILIAADPKVLDVVSEYHLNEIVASKISYVGYIKSNATYNNRIREERGLGNNQQWVVCSAGGGRGAEPFLLECIETAIRFEKVEFDIVFGPYSTNVPDPSRPIPPNCRISKVNADLPNLLASCDVAITNGGYNSFLEACVGGARIIVHPNRSEPGNEQRVSSMKLSEHYPITVLDSAGDLGPILRETLLASARNGRPKFGLKQNGTETIKELLDTDLSIV